jgi:hypothetical protein
MVGASLALMGPCVGASTDQATSRILATRSTATYRALPTPCDVSSMNAGGTTLRICTAVFKATTVTSARGTLQAIPLEATLDVLRKHSALGWDEPRPHGR